MSLRRSSPLLSRAFLSSLGMAAQGLGRFAYTWAIGRFLGPEPLGEVSALLSLSVYAALFWPAGLSVTAARNLATPGVAERSVGYLRRSFWAGVAITTPVFLALAWVLTGDAVAAITTGALVFTYAGYTFTRGVLLGRDRLVATAVWDTIAAAATLLVVTGVVLGQWHWGLMLPLVTGYGAFMLAAWPREGGPPTDPDDRARWRAFTFAATWGALATGGLLPATMVFVRAFDEGAAGYFGAALSLATPLSMLSQALNQVLVPHFSRIASTSSHGLLRSHRRIFVLTSAAFVLGFGGLIVVAPWLITFVYGDQFAAGTLAMQALLAIVALMSCMSAPSALLMAGGQQRLYATIWVVASIVGMLAMVIAAPQWGQWGAMIGYGLGGGGGALAVIVAGLLLRPEHVEARSKVVT